MMNKRKNLDRLHFARTNLLPSTRAVSSVQRQANKQSYRRDWYRPWRISLEWRCFSFLRKIEISERADLNKYLPLINT